ncbi:hypothetical protein VNO78_22843 [Psophocarpus tetragonolobus]|uniref:Uncharacterized protein n=1 Tax=Psophocarpus tetragonolobus TaxID=3891 RepID=A0AAN9S2Z7_PSOTE
MMMHTSHNGPSFLSFGKYFRSRVFFPHSAPGKVTPLSSCTKEHGSHFSRILGLLFLPNPFLPTEVNALSMLRSSL